MNLILLILVLYTEASKKLTDGHDVRAYIEVGQSQVFELDMLDLKPDTKYEVRISYLGTLAGHFSIDWDCWTGGRKLLDTEKIVFFTDKDKKIPGGCHRISVKANRNSRGSSKKAAELGIWFNIKLESYSSAIPVPNSVVSLVVALMSLFILIPVLFLFLKSRLMLLSSDLKLDSNKVN